MKIYSTIPEIKAFLTTQKMQNLTVGFVPTMGALHNGHISLIERAKKENDLCVCSIFVNPIQFNNPDDFKRYPVRTEKDIVMLKNAGCDVLFNPDKSEMYPAPVDAKYDFGAIEKVMEGAFRPGHFNGVAIVVKRLFEIIEPDKAYFGEKDYQQLQIIKMLVKKEEIPVTIVPCPIIRDADGLALSSRNALLSAHERSVAPKIAAILNECSSLAHQMSVAELKSFVQSKIMAVPEFKVEYFEIADGTTLQPVSAWSESDHIRAFIAVYLHNVRLIDNVRIFL
ncbi:MAG TPA: pantoate--beta-alanine ligase [Bacteroidales bacterium]|nr:pantoate--beta-alanine ligase [Bacteroidales bacterium]